MMTSTAFITLYVTCSSHEEAKALGRMAVEQKLAACANIFPGHISIYEWDGATREENETALLLKTRRSLFDDLKNLIVKQHSYDCPCIVAWPIIEGHEPYLQWISDGTKSG